ncbi:MAG: hypothetical protein LBR56_01865 [Sporomusaceae bacterium]|jgi:hypothetical protein|nr:hypothetical protein [Sporomusaceae bacterium]
MKIMVLSIREKSAGTIVADVKKDFIHLEYLYHDTTPILPFIKNGQAENIAAYLTARMSEAKVSNIPIYLSLPPSCSKIDCFKTEYSNDETILDFVKTKLQSDSNEDYTVDIPMSRGKYGAFYTTGAGVPLKIIDSLLEAATAANIDVASIEPDILAAVRFIWQYDQRFLVLDIGETTAYLTGYDHSRGFFTTPYGTLGTNSLLAGGLGGLKKELRLFGMVAQETLGSDSFENSPLYIFTDCQRKPAQKIMSALKTDAEISPRVVAMGNTTLTKISSAKNLKSELIYTSDCFNLPLGLALKSLFERRSTLAQSANDEFITGKIPLGEEMPENEESNKTWRSYFNRFLERNNLRRNSGNSL